MQQFTVDHVEIISVTAEYIERRSGFTEMIEYMQEKGGVWFATMEEIARHVRSAIDDGSYSPRVDDLPYYDGRIPELGEADLGPSSHGG